MAAARMVILSTYWKPAGRHQRPFPLPSATPFQPDPGAFIGLCVLALAAFRRRSQSRYRHVPVSLLGQSAAAANERQTRRRHSSYRQSCATPEAAIDRFERTEAKRPPRTLPHLRRDRPAPFPAGNGGRIACFRRLFRKGRAEPHTP